MPYVSSFIYYLVLASLTVFTLALIQNALGQDGQIFVRLTKSIQHYHIRAKTKHDRVEIQYVKSILALCYDHRDNIHVASQDTPLIKALGRVLLHTRNDRVSPEGVIDSCRVFHFFLQHERTYDARECVK